MAETDLIARIELILQGEESPALLSDEVKALGPAAVPILIEKIRGGQGDGKSMERAILVLGQIGGNEAADFVASLLNDQDEIVKGTALTALREIGDRASAPAVTALLNDASNFVRKEAIKTLAQLGNPSSLTRLREMAQSENPEFLKEQAQSAIAEIESREV